MVHLEVQPAQDVLLPGGPALGRIQVVLDVARRGQVEGQPLAVGQGVVDLGAKLLAEGLEVVKFVLHRAPARPVVGAPAHGAHRREHGDREGGAKLEGEGSPGVFQ